MSAITDYLRAVRDIHRGGSATELSYRAALAALIEAVGVGVVATNEPKRHRDCGAPDMSVTDGKGPEALKIGYIECKDIGVSLDEAAKNEQLTRYRENLDNLILTDYLEFRWYVEGEERMRATLATPSGTQTRSPGAPAWTAVPGGEENLSDLLTSFLQHTPEPITSPEELARRMARITRMIRDIIIIEFNTGDQGGATSYIVRSVDWKPEEFAFSGVRGTVRSRERISANRAGRFTCEGNNRVQSVVTRVGMTGVRE